MEAEKDTLFTVEDYVAAEDGAETRHEYLSGTIHAMSGASRRHNEIGRQSQGTKIHRLEWHLW
jgi:hypothetical protein